MLDVTVYDARYVAAEQRKRKEGSEGESNVKDGDKDDEDTKLLLLDPRDGFSAECLLTYEREAPCFPR